jgi:hypothetical protein
MDPTNSQGVWNSMDAGNMLRTFPQYYGQDGNRSGGAALPDGSPLSISSLLHYPGVYAYVLAGNLFKYKQNEEVTEIEKSNTK